MWSAKTASPSNRESMFAVRRSTDGVDAHTAITAPANCPSIRLPRSAKYPSPSRSEKMTRSSRERSCRPSSVAYTPMACRIPFVG
jgi:hypothetical protein